MSYATAFDAASRITDDIPPSLLREEVLRLREEVMAGVGRERDLQAAVRSAETRARERGELLNEVNHRAKNSIQIAMSLLNIQRHSSSDPGVREALASAVERLGHVAKAHSMLYGHSPDEQAIDFREYLTSLCRETGNALDDGHVMLVVEADELTLDTPRAINLALIAGEAITNAIKHAFPGGRTGTISVVCRAGGPQVTLLIEDDGVGLATDGRDGSMGMRLIRTLSKALSGTVRIDSGPGTRVMISFPA